MEGIPKKATTEGIAKRLEKVAKAVAFGAAMAALPTSESEAVEKFPLSIEQSQNYSEQIDDFFEKAVNAHSGIDDARGRQGIRTKISVWFDALASNYGSKAELKQALIKKITHYEGEHTPGFMALYDVLQGMPQGFNEPEMPKPPFENPPPAELKGPDFPGKQKSEVRRTKNLDW